MKKHLLYFVSIFIFTINCTKSHASSILVSGLISSNTTWSVDTVKVTSNVKVLPGIKLIIAPKTHIIFQGYYGIQIYAGILEANGTINDSITFTINDTTNFFDINKAQGGWQGISFVGTSASYVSTSLNQFSFCKFNYVKYTSAPYLYYNGAHGNVITSIYYTNIHINNCLISNNNTAALMIESSSDINIANCVIQNNNNKVNFSAVCSSNSNNIVIEKNNISYNLSKLAGGGVSILNSYNNKITNNKICNNNALGWGCGGAYGGGGIYLENAQTSYIANNLIANNSTIGTGGGICSYNSNPEIINNTIVNNHADYLGGGIGGTNTNSIIKNNILNANTHSEIFSGFIYSNFSKNQISLISSASGQITSCNLEGGFSDIKCLIFNGTMMAYVNFNGTYTNNINVTSDFFSTSAGSGVSFDGLAPDWRLQNSSPCINTGTLNSIGNMPTTDLWYNPRIVGSSIDIGAYEAPSEFNPNGINDFENNSNLSVYPNPAKDVFAINYSKDYEKATVSLVNIMGQTIETKQFNNSEKMNFNTTDYSEGTYFLNIVIDNERMSSKLILQ